MSTLTLTEEEQKIAFNQWDDASLGRAVKHIANIIGDDDGKAALKYTAAAVFLIQGQLVSGAEETILTIDAAHDEKDTQLGDWIITVKKVKEPESEDDTVADDTAKD